MWNLSLREGRLYKTGVWAHKAQLPPDLFSPCYIAIQEGIIPPRDHTSPQELDHEGHTQMSCCWALLCVCGDGMTGSHTRKKDM